MGKSNTLSQKSFTKSKTIRVGTVYISAGLLVAILQAFDMLKPLIASIDTDADNAATWVGLGLAIIGGVQVWLRTITNQPIGNEPLNPYNRDR